MADDEASALPPARSVKELTDPKALRALAHPIRLALLGLLRTEGPLTATKAGELLGESSASASFHLRQLSKYGLVEEAGGGTGRERPWRATSMFTNVPHIAGNPEFDAASGLFRSLLAERYFSTMMEWLELRPTEAEEWQNAATQNDVWTYVTADELIALTEQVQALLDVYADRLTDPALRPPGARLVQHIELAFPIDNRPARAAKDREASEGGAS
jgi:DNA-binding transcriptional ArsR family regulator